MKIQLVIVGIVILLLVVGLSGCEELTGNGDVSGDTSKVELLDYNVISTWVTGAWTLNRQEHEQNGFFYDDSSDASNHEYKITGTIKNKAGYKLERIVVTAKLYDSNGIFLDSKDDTVYDIPDTYTEDFSISFFVHNTDRFENVNSVKFEFTAS